MLGTVLNDAHIQGKAAIQLAAVLSRGEAPTKQNIGFDITDNQYVWIPYKKITRDNVADVE